MSTLRPLVGRLQAIVGDGAWTTDNAVLEPNLTEWRGAVRGKTAIMVSPSTREQVAAIVTECAAAGTAIVPQGGNTGMCAGAVPDGSGSQVLLNLARLNRIRSIDPADFSLIAEAGCVLADIHRAASDVRRYFPLSHGGEGSSQIGGNLSTNAGGINVLRYGTARSQVLGLEVVLANGALWNGLRTLRKDTAGYDLKHLFVGSEGTLGIITAAALKLYPAPGDTQTSLIALNDVAAAVGLLGTVREGLADGIQAFELIGARAFELVLRHIPAARLPFGRAYPWYVLAETSAAPGDGGLPRILADGADSGLVADAVVAKNAAESDALWRMRHAISEAEKREGPAAKHDVSVPIGRIEEFLREADIRMRRSFPEVAPVVFGHVGDGNLHYNAVLPRSASATAQRTLREAVSELVYELVIELDGSISAEHGIGLLKKPYLNRYKDDTELGLMRALKSALDPDNVLNPGKVI